MAEEEKLTQAALAARKNAYTPYSHFPVGASLLLKDGNIISGCNIENAAFGLSICAERCALFHAYARGYKKDDLKSLTVIADTEGPVSPCGACRQVICELMPDAADVILKNLKGAVKVFKVRDLLPYAFKKDALKGV